jgi:hypothetical protein
VLEAAADEGGSWVPVTPVVAAVPASIGLWHLLSSLLSPAASAWASARAGGTGMSPAVLRVSAGLVRAVPLPDPSPAWDEAADLVASASRAADDGARRHALVGAAEASCRAYGVAHDPLVGWWLDQLPRRTP